jgi:hypothetical protein
VRDWIRKWLQPIGIDFRLSEIERELTVLVEEGLANAYLLSPTESPKKVQSHSLHKYPIKKLWFYVSVRGRAHVRFIEKIVEAAERE